MILREAIGNLDALPERATIFAERVDGHFAPDSNALVLELSDEESARPIRDVAARRAPGLHYFLEVFVAHDVLAGWREMRQTEQIEPEEAITVVLYYAKHDAWPTLDVASEPAL